MPIRSPRGRSAAYRAVWGWPLRSPVRLVVSGALVVAVLLAVSALAGLLGPGPAGSSSFGTAGPTTALGGRSPSPGEPTTLPPVAPLTPTSLPLSAAPPAALQTARDWVAAWATHPEGVTVDRWVAGLRPYTTEEYIGTLDAVDPANIPATTITGAVRAVQVAPASVSVDVPTDALTLRVLVVKTEAGWRVSGFDRV